MVARVEERVFAEPFDAVERSVHALVEGEEDENHEAEGAEEGG
ncbi:hypothetical protein [Sorangium sp. So ce887]